MEIDSEMELSFYLWLLGALGDQPEIGNGSDVKSREASSQH